MEESPRASPNPVGNQSSCLFRGRPPKYRKIQQEDFQSKYCPLRSAIAEVGLKELGWWLLEAGLPWLTQSDLTQVSTIEELVVNYQS